MDKIVVYRKYNNDNIYLFEDTSIDSAIERIAFYDDNLPEILDFRKYKNEIYALKGGIEIKLFS